MERLRTQIQTIDNLCGDSIGSTGEANDNVHTYLRYVEYCVHLQQARLMYKRSRKNCHPRRDRACATLWRMKEKEKKGNAVICLVEIIVVQQFIPSYLHLARHAWG